MVRPLANGRRPDREKLLGAMVLDDRLGEVKGDFYDGFLYVQFGDMTAAQAVMRSIS